jgi:hypothetical protein
VNGQDRGRVFAVRPGIRQELIVEIVSQSAVIDAMDWESLGVLAYRPTVDSHTVVLSQRL